MKTQCPNCKAKFNTNEASVGKQAKCPKCAKPFTIEPFVETPAAGLTAEHAETAEKNDKINSASSAVSAVKSNAPPVKSPEPTAPPAKAAIPIAPPAPVAPPVKSTIPIEPPVKSPEPKIAEPAKEEKPESKPASKTPAKSGLSKLVFVYCWIVIRLIAGGLAASGLMLAIRKAEHSTLIATFAAADVFLVCSVLIELLLFYKMWAAIADSQASTTPAKAVGFLFIPVFNIYWALNMVIGFAEDYNAFIERRSIKVRDLSLTLFMIYAFMFMLTMIFVTTPMLCVFAFVGLIARAFYAYAAVLWLLLGFASAAGLGHFIAYVLSATKICNAVNALSERKGR